MELEIVADVDQRMDLERVHRHDLAVVVRVELNNRRVAFRLIGPEQVINPTTMRD